AEHCRGRHAVAQSDWRSRTATSRRRFHGLCPYRPVPALSRLLVRLAPAGTALGRQAFTPKSTRTDLREWSANQSSLVRQVRALIDKGKTWVKLSGAYADTKVGPPTYADSTAVAQAYAKAGPEGCVWGSDWPRCEPRSPPNKPAQLSAPFRARAGPFL